MRALLSGLLVLASLVLGTAAFSAAWLERNIVAEDGFTALGEPLGRDAAFQAELRTSLGEEAAAAVQLPAPVASLVAPAVEQVLQGLQETPGYPQAWTDSLAASHRDTFAAGDEPRPAVLNLTPMASLVLDSIGQSVGAELQAPSDVVVEVGPATRWPERIDSLAGLWPVLAIGAGVALLLALAVARRRGAVLAWTGGGVLVAATAVWLAVGALPGAVAAAGGSSGGPVASAFAEALARQAGTSIHGWLVPVLLGGGVLLVLGLLISALTPRTRR